MKQTLSMFTLGVADLKKSLEFYEGVLGWKRSGESQSGSIAFFDLGGFLLGLYPRQALAEDATVSAEGGGFAGVALAHNVGSKEEADEVMKQVKERGGRILKPAADTFWGGYGGYIADPDGYPMEVVFNPFWKLDDGGHIVLPS